MGDVSDRSERPVLRVVSGGNKDRLSPPRLTFMARQAGSVYEHLVTDKVLLLRTDLPDSCPFSHVEVSGHNYDYEGIAHTVNPQEYSFTACFDVRPEIKKSYFNKEKIDDIINRMITAGYEAVYEDGAEDGEFDHLKITRDGRVYFLDFRFPEYCKGWKNINIIYLRKPDFTGPALRQIDFRSDSRILPQGDRFSLNADYVNYAEALTNITAAMFGENTVNFSLNLTPQ